MEPRQQLVLDGQEVQLEDLNAGWQVGSLADDRVFAELFRLAPYTGGNFAKAIFPFGQENPYGGACSIEATGSANGSVRAMPFRAMVGSRQTVAQFIAAGETNAQAATDNWRDARSGVFGNSSDGTSLPDVVALAANASGNPRWDLLYATLAVEANGPSVSRYVKPAIGGAPAISSIVGSLIDPVTVSVVQGTPGASPAFPTAPADGGGSFYFPLAYVRVPNGFNGASTVSPRDIYDVSTPAKLARTTGGGSHGPADQQFTLGGTLLTRTPWGTGAGTRPGCFLPPSMSGMESRQIALEMVGGTPYANGDVIDASLDWRYRAFIVFTFAIGTSGVYAFGDPTAAGTATDGAPVAPGIGYIGKNWGSFVTMSSSTFQSTLAMNGGGNEYAVALYMQNASLIGTTISFQANSSSWGYWIDPSSGALKFYTNGTNPNVAAFSWIFMTAPFSNY